MKTIYTRISQSARPLSLWCGIILLFILSFEANAQCIPTTSTGFQENLLQATFHTVLYQTPNGYAASGEGTDVNGGAQTNIQEISNANGYTGIPANTTLVWGTLGGHAQLVFLGDDNIIYAGGIQGRVLNNALTPSNAYGPTSLPMPPGVDHSDVVRFQASNNVIILMTQQGQIFTSGNTCGNIATPCASLNWTEISLPPGVLPLMIDLSAKTLFMYGDDGNFYTRGARVFAANGANWFANAGSWVQMTAPPMSNGSVPVQIELANHEDQNQVSYLVLDVDGTIHSMGNAPVVANNSNSSFVWAKVGENCPDGILTGVVFISASDNDDRHVGAGAILEDGSIRLWGVDDNNMLAGAISECPSEICTEAGTVMTDIVYLENGTHLTPAIGEGGMLCNVGHNSDGGFGDGTEDDRECYECYQLPPLPELCINGDCGLDTTVQVTICAGQTYFEQLSEYTSTGIYTDVYQSSLGCDSTVTTELTVLSVIEILNEVSICDGESYFEGSSEYSVAGIYVDTYQSINGCDSIVTTDLSINPNVSTTNTVFICEGESYFEQSSEYTSAGIYIDTYQTALGCDSVVTTDLTVHPIPEITNSVSICEGESYFDQLSEYTQTGIYTDVYQSINGCDSIVTTDLTVNPVLNTTNSVSICDGDVYFEQSSEYTVAGTYVDTYQTVLGCDSIVTTVLTVNPVFAITNEVSICDGESYFEGSSEYTVAGIYVDAYQTINGCDSIVTTDLSINPIVSTTNTVFICEGESYFEQSSEYTSAGIYIDTYQTALGCDSVVTTDLTVHPIPSITNTVSICDGESYFDQLSEYTQTGIYTDIYQSINGCDSIVTTDLTVNPVLNTTNTVSICDGDSYFEQSSEYTVAGTYVDTYQTVLGCDSIVTTVLTVNPVFAITNEVSICDGESYFEGSSEYTVAGVYVDAYQTINGCDSVVTTILTVNPVFEQTNQLSICEGESYFEGASEYTQTGIYTDIYQTEFGCDSIVITELTVNLPSATTNEVVICDGEVYFEQSSEYTETGVYIDVYQNALGCDSVVTTILTVNPIPTFTVDAFICEGDTYFEQNSAYTESGIYIDVYQSVLGCDSIVTTNLTVHPAIVVEAGPDMTGCPGTEHIISATASGGVGGPYIYTWDALGAGQSHTVSPFEDTFYTVYAVDEFGCEGFPDHCLVDVITMDDDELSVELSDEVHCTGTTAVLQAYHQGPQDEYIYQWNQDLPAELGPFEILSVTDTWYVLQVTDMCSNVIQDSVFLDVVPLPNVQIAPLPSVGCAPHTIQFSEEGHHAEGATFQWFFGDGNTSNEEEPNYTYFEEGEYFYSLTVTNPSGCSATSESIGLIDVVGNPQAGITASTFILDDTNSIVYFESSSSDDVVAWAWDFGDGGASDMEDPGHDFEEIGDYTISLIVENDFGCRDTSYTHVEVTPVHELIIPNAFTPNPNGGNGGVFDINSIDNDVFFPWTDSVSEFEMLIYNRWGELIFQSNDLKIGWDGYYKGQMSQQDVYVYRINISYEDGLEVERVGNISLYK